MDRTSWTNSIKAKESTTSLNFPHPTRLLLGDPEITANLYCNFAYPFWEGCVICSIYLR